MFTKTLVVLLLTAVCGRAQQQPTPAAAEWWSLTTALSNDSMQGRDTGTQAYERAARYVAEQFTADGLKPAGDRGTYLQRLAMHEIDLDLSRSSVQLVDHGGRTEELKLMAETTLQPRGGMPEVTTGKLVFIGYGPEAPGADLHGKIAVFFNNIPAAATRAEREGFNGARAAALAQSGAAGLVSIDNPAAIEPTHWPAAYARTVRLEDAVKAATSQAPVAIRISAEAAAKLFAGTRIDAQKLFVDAEAGRPLPVTELARSLRIQVKMTEKEISSSNVLAVLPGSDPSLAAEYVALSAHLDGYGYGTPVLGDSLYNGTLDDAAYVATLLELANKLSAPGATRPKRSLLFAIFTGEEKGLLGSEYFTKHLTVPADQIVADLNLDQLRPIFPLKILTMEGIADSSLGETARSVAEAFHIELRPDREPQRNLFRRADNFNFVRIGVPIAAFIFGYDPASEEERIYRDWYARRYHKPQDDLQTPIDWDAAVKFNDFYRALALCIADDAARPAWLPSSIYRPGTSEAKP